MNREHLGGLGFAAAGHPQGARDHRPLGEGEIRLPTVGERDLIGSVGGRAEDGAQLNVLRVDHCAFVTGSLATVLWLIALRREGEQISGWQFFKAGLVVMPPALLLATLAATLLSK